MDSLLQTRQMSSANKYGDGPYPPRNASLGGHPTNIPDIPISAVFILLYAIAAASHMTILQLNLRRGHKFIISGLLFGFCMARIVAQILRIVWASYPNNLNVAIASNVFVQAGVVLLFVVNLLFAQRIIRAAHPHIGWHKAVHFGFIAMYVLVVLTLIMLITATIQSFFTLNAETHRIDRDIQLYGGTFYAIISFLPIPLVIFGLLIHRKTRLEKFGQGRWREKIIILLVSATLLCLGASFRIGVNYAGGKRPISNPASYQSKACFYVFNYVVEYIVIILYVIVRVDRRFWVPDGSHKAGDYSRTEEQILAAKAGRGEKEGAISRIISPEEETFDDMDHEQLARLPTKEGKKDLEKGSRVVTPKAETRSLSGDS